jgi:hypothetical protein
METLGVLIPQPKFGFQEEREKDAIVVIGVALHMDGKGFGGGAVSTQRPASALRFFGADSIMMPVA